MLPGIESWYEVGNKSKTGKKMGLDKVEQVAEQVNMILRHIPYMQTNFVLGLDSDEGDLPFELTKRFLDRAPGAFPGFSLLTAFGRSAPLNLHYQQAGRVLPVPFRFLENRGAMNVRPKNYQWPDFYEKTIDLLQYSFSPPAIVRRVKANRGWIPRTMNAIRAMSKEGWGTIRYFQQVRRQLDQDRSFRDFFEQESSEIPQFFVEAIRKDLGPLWEWLPKGALNHDPNSYLKTPVLMPATIGGASEPGPNPDAWSPSSPRGDRV